MKKEHAIILGLFVLAVLLRLPHLDDKVTALDEPHTMGDIRPGLAETLREAAADNRGPLYYFLLWPASFGGVIAMRFLSVVLGALSIIVSYFFVREVLGKRPAVIASVLLAFHPFHIVYSQYVRDNMLLFLILAFSLWQFYRFVKNSNHRNLIGICIANILLFYTHNIAPLFIVSQLLTVCILKIKEPRSIRNFAIQIFVVAIAIIPWALYVQQQTGFGIGVPPINHDILRIPHTIYKLSIGIDASTLLSIHPLILAFVVAFFSILFVESSGRMLKKEPFIAKFLLLQLFLPILLLFTVSATIIQLYNYRYIAPLLPVYAAIIAWRLSILPKKYQYLACAAILLCYILGDIYYFSIVTGGSEWTLAFGI